MKGHVVILEVDGGPRKKVKADVPAERDQTPLALSTGWHGRRTAKQILY